MKKILALAFIVSLAFSCKNTEAKQEENVVEKEAFDMYQPSEMAALMEYMYTYNTQVRQSVIDGKNPGAFPNEFFKINTAELTDRFHRDAEFEKFAKIFLKAEMDIFNPVSTIPVTDRYNTMVNACISCHQTSCTGPIPRIKKLLIP